MDIIQNPSYKDLQEIYKKYFSLGTFGDDITNKFALISLVNWVYQRLKSKNPDITHYQVLKKIVKDDSFSTDFLKGLSVVCSDFGYCVKEFPTFNIPEKEIPKKIKELLDKYLPF